MKAEMSYCDTPEKPFAFENQYISASLKVFSPRDKLQIRGTWQNNLKLYIYFFRFAFSGTVIC